MAPAGERLQSDDPAGAELDDRLVPRHDIPGSDRLGDIGGLLVVRVGRFGIGQLEVISDDLTERAEQPGVPLDYRSWISIEHMQHASHRVVRTQQRNTEVRPGDQPVAGEV